MSRSIDDKIQIFAGSRDKVGNTCSGDSGGPLLAVSQWNKKVKNVVGVTSFGKGCGFKGLPGIYTRVSHYLPWIEENVWPGDIKDI